MRFDNNSLHDKDIIYMYLCVNGSDINAYRLHTKNIESNIGRHLTAMILSYGACHLSTISALQSMGGCLGSP